ncbi:uncharacterized protein LTR77_007417 [Saxophila tyrrhenica]|uniref:AAA+ ATPase domain-containing protein n=1 Tax=Saxophila tyrrhenica TaxID=1690608 RepID=A0AAV9P5C4_9PEZI|nr:hypothetical protein LTR77_007417 [Saxophila tyrrhenica]
MESAEESPQVNGGSADPPGTSDEAENSTGGPGEGPTVQTDHAKSEGAGATNGTLADKQPESPVDGAAHSVVDDQSAALMEELKSLRALLKANGSEPDILVPEKEEHEARLMKISYDKFRQVKRWPLGVWGKAPDTTALLLSMDGAEHGIRRATDTAQRNQDSSDAPLAEGLPSKDATDTVPEIPFRLVFNDEDWPELMKAVTGFDISFKDPVHVRPFKYLLAYENKIRAALEKCKQHDLQAASTESASGEAEDAGKDDANATESKEDNTEAAGKDGAKAPEPANSDADAGVKDDAKASDSKEASAAPKPVDLGGIEATPRRQALLQLLVSFMDVEMKDILDVRKRVADRTLSEISFEYLLHLYKPGDIILSGATSDPDARRAYRVLSVTGGRPYFKPKYDAGIKERSRSFRIHERSFIGALEVDKTDSISIGLQGRATRMTPLVIDCFYLDFDGTNYGPRPMRFIIPEYRGQRRVTELDVYPGEFDPTFADIRQQLRSRGAKFMECVQGAHKEYDGDSLEDTLIFTGRANEKVASQKVDCECIIDHKALFSILESIDLPESPGNKLGFNSGVIATPTDSNIAECFDLVHCSVQGCVSCTDTFDDNSFDLTERDDFVTDSALLDLTTDLTDEHLELLPLRVYGYALKHRNWFALNLLHCKEPRCIRNVDAARSAFKDLVLPPNHKRMIRALVRYQLREFEGSTRTQQPNAKGTHFDLIHGKGRGMVLLLHGVPGVGKTSTAESVAIQLKRPLLPITCGDLGTDAGEVERNLDSFFALGNKWGCVILLDEADVFMAKRTTGDHARNALVSVFLRQMEYNAGVLILTTNRVGEFDEAFVSRIHMKLHYPQLHEDSTMEIWRMNIRRLKDSGAVRLNEDKTMAFARDFWRRNRATPDRQWNGRQIKNAFQTAVALAYYEWEGSGKDGPPKDGPPKLRDRHFEDVAETSLRFDDYIDNTFGTVIRKDGTSRGGFANDLSRTKVRSLDVDDHHTPSPEPVRSTRRNERTLAKVSEAREARVETKVERRIDRLKESSSTPKGGRNVKRLPELDDSDEERSPLQGTTAYDSDSGSGVRGGAQEDSDEGYD